MGTVVIKWECLELSERNYEPYIIKVSTNAIYCNKSGWVCDCGEWTTGDDEKHTALRFGNRECPTLKNKKNISETNEWEKTYYKSEVYPYPESFEPLSYYERLHDSQREEIEYLKKKKAKEQYSGFFYLNFLLLRCSVAAASVLLIIEVI